MHEHLIESQRGGSPVIAGTELTVEAILRELAAGETVDHVLTAHPELSRESILAVLAFAAEKIHGDESRPSLISLNEALGAFVPQTPLAKELWELRQAAIKEALERGEPLLQSWEEVRQEVRERRGERDRGDEGALHFMSASLRGLYTSCSTPNLSRKAYAEACTMGLAALDAFHIVAARAGGVTEFITTERSTSPLFRVSGLTITTPDSA